MAFKTRLKLIQQWKTPWVEGMSLMRGLAFSSLFHLIPPKLRNIWKENLSHPRQNMDMMFGIMWGWNFDEPIANIGTLPRKLPTTVAIGMLTFTEKVTSSILWDTLDAFSLHYLLKPFGKHWIGFRTPSSKQFPISLAKLPVPRKLWYKSSQSFGLYGSWKKCLNPF